MLKKVCSRKPANARDPPRSTQAIRRGMRTLIMMLAAVLARSPPKTICAIWPRVTSTLPMQVFAITRASNSTAIRANAAMVRVRVPPSRYDAGLLMLMCVPFASC